MTQRRSVNDSWPTLLALVVLGLFWSFWGLLRVWDVFRWIGAGPEFASVLLGDLQWAVLFIGFGLAHLLAAFGLRAGSEWAVVLAAALALVGLLLLGAAARALMMLTVDVSGQFDIETISVWRFDGWQVIGIFGVLVLANAVVLVAVARASLGRPMRSVAERPPR